MANEFIIRKGYKSLASSEVTGSLTLIGNYESIRALTINSTKGSGTEHYFRTHGVNGDTLAIYSGGNRVLSIDSNSIDVLGSISGSTYYGDGSNLTNVTATSYTETDTLQTVTNRGASTTNAITINPSGNAILNINGTADSFVEKDTGTTFYIANNVSDQQIRLRVKDGSTNVNALILDGANNGNATFSGTVKAATSFIADAVSTSNNDPGTDNVQVSGYGLIGNRGNLYITNANTDSAATVQIGVGGVHNGSPKLSIGPTNSHIRTNLLPGTDSTYNIGSASSRFSVGYFDSLQITNVVTNKILKFDGSDIDDSIMSDDGSTVSVAGDMTVTGTITAQEFHTEFVSASILYESGSTKFGDTSDDIHSFSGSLRVTGSGDHYFSNGDVGIGTTNPIFRLDVESGGSSEAFGLSLSGTERLKMYADGTWNYFEAKSGQSHKFTTTGGALLTILNAGNVGIGTTDPGKELHVAGAISGSAIHAIGGSITNKFYSTNGGAIAEFKPSDTRSGTQPIFLYRSSVNGSANYMLANGNTTLFGLYDSGVPTDASGMIRIVPNNNNEAPQVLIGDAGSNAASLSVGGNIKLLNDGTSYISGGNVGIGTTSADHKLHVVGNSAIAAIDGADTNGTPMLFIGEQNSYGVGFRWDSGLTLNIIDFDNTTISSTGGTKIGHFKIRDEEFYWKGSVGIGTDSPAFKLDVRNGSNLGGTAGDTQTQAIFQTSNSNTSRLEIKDVRTATGTDWTTAGKRIQHKIDSTWMGYIQFSGDGNNYGMSFGTGGTSTAPGNVTEKMRIESGGDVGIGTNNPSELLHLYQTGNNAPLLVHTDDHSGIKIKGGNSHDRYISFQQTNGSVGSKIGWDHSAQVLKLNGVDSFGSTHLVVDVNGQVGIGTDSPNTLLHLYDGGANGATTTDLLKLQAYTGDFGATPAAIALAFKFQDSNNATNEARIRMATVNDTDYGDNDEAASNFIFSTTNGGTESDKMIITGRGNVGIGTINPSSLLHLAGVSSQLFVENTSSSGQAYIKFKARSDRDAGPFIKATARGATAADSDLRFGDETGDIMTLNGGNVGIGSVSPGNMLDVMGNVSASAYYGDGSNLTGITAGGTDTLDDVVERGATTDNNITINGLRTNADSTHDIGTNGVRFLNGYFDNLHTKDKIQNNTANYINYISNQGHRFYIDANNDDTSHKFQILSNTSTYAASNVIVDIDQAGIAYFSGSATFGTVLDVVAPDGGSSPAMTAVINMKGYDGRGVGIKMRDNVTTSGGGTNREWFVGTGYNSTGFNIGYASDGSQSSYAAQSKLSITTAGNATFAGDVNVNGTDFRLGSSLANFEAGFGVDIADKEFNYGAEFQATNASIQIVLGRNNGTSVQGKGAIGADQVNAFAVWDTGSVTRIFEVAQTSGNATFAGTLTIPSYIYHKDDPDTYIGFSGANSFKVHTGGSDRFSVTGDVGVLGSTDFFIPQGRKLLLDGAGGHTYIEEESDSNLKFYVAGSERLNITNADNSFSGDVITSGYFQVNSTAALLKKYVSAWTNATTHDILYNSWQSNIGDYTYLKAAGNSTGGHGIILAADNGTYLGTTDVEAGSLTNSGTAPLTNTWAYFRNATAYIKGDTTFGGDVTVAGTITAQEFHTEFVSASIIYESGSTKFGDTSDDNHDFTGSVNIDGTLTATVKSFDIVHPTQEGKRLIYGVLEGPEHAVYVRGESKADTVILPEEWVGLVDETSITAQFTPIGKPDIYYYEGYENNTVKVGGPEEKNYFYYIQATRKDVEPLITVQ